MLKLPRHAISIIDETISQHTKPTTRERSRERLRYGLYNIASQVYLNEPLRLHKDVIKKSITTKNYPAFKEVASQLFSRDNYKVGARSYSYRYKELTEPETVEVPEEFEEYVRKYRIALSAYWREHSEACATHWQMMLKLTLNRQQARENIEGAYPLQRIESPLRGRDIKALRELYNTNHKKLKGETPEVLEAVALASKREAALKDLKTWSTPRSKRAPLLYVKLDQLRTGRIYSTFTGTSRHVRAALRLNGKALIEGDLRKSHGSIIAKLAQMSLIQSDKGKSELNKSDAIFLEFYDLIDTVRKGLPTQRGASPSRPPFYWVHFSKELGRYRALLAGSEGKTAEKIQREFEMDIYRREANYQRHHAKRITATPEQYLGTFKASFMYWLNGDPNEPKYKRSRAVRYFAKSFPSLHNMITYLKTAASYETASGRDNRGGPFQIDVSSKPFSALPIKLMRIEAAIMRETFKGLPVLYLHDACYFSPELKEQVEARAWRLPEPLQMEFK